MYPDFNDFNDFGGPASRYIKVEDIGKNEVIKLKIKKVTTQTYSDGVKPIAIFEDGRFIVLNQARREALIAAYGSKFDDCVGKLVGLRRAEIIFAGDPVATIVIDPIDE
jgi:hypothetical protein